MKEISKEIYSLRSDYSGEALDESIVDPYPVNQFSKWMEEALLAKLDDVNSFVLSTVEGNKPSSRVVLLRGFDQSGFSFFTNYNSDKGKHIAANPNVALNFFWPALSRQVRIEGSAEKLSEKESEDYFSSRPKPSQVGAWASAQSSRIPGRAVLEELFASLDEQYKSSAVPRPPHWGGYLIVPTMFEFWQGRLSRLHDRIRYDKKGDGWQISRLAP